MATKKNSDGTRKVRVLLDCWAGLCGQVVTMPDADVDRLIADGAGDDDPASIAAGEA